MSGCYPIFSAMRTINRSCRYCRRILAVPHGGQQIVNGGAMDVAQEQRNPFIDNSIDGLYCCGTG